MDKHWCCYKKHLLFFLSTFCRAGNRMWVFWFEAISSVTALLRCFLCIALVLVARGLWWSPHTACCSKQGSLQQSIRTLSALSCLVLKISQDKDPTASLGKLCLCFVALMKGYVNWNFPSCTCHLSSPHCVPRSSLISNLPSDIGRLGSDPPLALLPRLSKTQLPQAFFAHCVLQLPCHVSDSPLDLLQVAELPLLWSNTKLNTGILFYL